MSDTRDFGQVDPAVAEMAKRTADRLLGRNDSQQTTGGLSSVDVLGQSGSSRTQGRAPWESPSLPTTSDRRDGRSPGRSPWDGPVVLPPTDRPPERPAPVNRGVLEVTYGEKDFDAKIAQDNYSKLVIKGLPKELSPSPWIDSAGNGYFFWLKNQKNPDASDRNRHFFPSNLKEIEIAQYQGNIYKPIMINADEMRISASQTYMRSQNQDGFGSFRGTTDVYTYAANMSKIAGSALQYQENLLREGAKNAPSNPYFHIYLADVLAAQSVQPVIEALANGKTAYFDNPQTRQKLEEAIRENQIALAITRQYGDIVKPPTYEMPLSPFGLNPYAYNPDYYWSGASYQAARREVQLSLLLQAVKLGRLPMELPPALPPRP